MNFWDTEPTPEEKQAAMVKALQSRLAANQTPQEPPPQASDFARAWGNVLQQAGDTPLGHFGRSQLQQGQQMEAMTDQEKQRTLSQILEAKRMASQELHQRKQEELQQQALNQGKFGSGPLGIYSTRTGEIVHDAPPKGGPSDKEMGKALNALQKDLDPSMGRAGEFGATQKRLNAAANLFPLIAQGKVADLNPSQMEELSVGLANVISGSSAPGQAVIHAIVPHTMSGSAAGILQWLTNEPHGAGQQAFAKQMEETLKREDDNLKKRIRDVQLSRLPAHIGTFKNYRDAARAVVQAHVPDIDFSTLDENTMLPIKSAPGTGGGGSGGGMTPEQRRAEIEALRKELGQ